MLGSMQLGGETVAARTGAKVGDGAEAAQAGEPLGVAEVVRERPPAVNGRDLRMSLVNRLDPGRSALPSPALRPWDTKLKSVMIR